MNAKPDATVTDRSLLADMLAEPFAPDEIKWKPQCVKGNRALAIAYVDARLVEDRLDAVFGPGGWQDAYAVLPSGDVVCTLRIRVDGEWVEKSDVGGQSEQPDEGDRMKAAFSDALKRAAVKLGIGRYLYRLGGQWVDYDEKARQFKRTPTLPAWALPQAKTVAVQAVVLPAKTNGQEEPSSNGKGIQQGQWEQLKAALARNRVPARSLLSHYGIVKPSELSTSKFTEAMELANKPPKAWFNSKSAVA